MYLKTVCPLSSMVCSSNLIGHCSQLLSSSSQYPMRKYIFLAGMPWRRMPAILIMLCCRLMITSEQKRSCHVPVINLLMKTSSTAVSAALKPSYKVPSSLKEQVQSNNSTRYLLKIGNKLVGVLVSQEFHDFRWAI